MVEKEVKAQDLEILFLSSPDCRLSLGNLALLLLDIHSEEGGSYLVGEREDDRSARCEGEGREGPRGKRVSNRDGRRERRDSPEDGNKLEEHGGDSESSVGASMIVNKRVLLLGRELLELVVATHESGSSLDT